MAHSESRASSMVGNTNSVNWSTRDDIAQILMDLLGVDKRNADHVVAELNKKYYFKRRK